MKLRNKKTGEIYETTSLIGFDYEDSSDYWSAQFHSLEELNEEWEDAPEEPKGIKSVGNIGSSVHIELGSKEEAEKAVEKLKAWKRMKDKGVKLEIVTIGHRKYLEPTAKDDKTFDEAKELIKDFELIFGGGE